LLPLPFCLFSFFYGPGCRFSPVRVHVFFFVFIHVVSSFRSMAPKSWPPAYENFIREKKIPRIPLMHGVFLGSLLYISTSPFETPPVISAREKSVRLRRAPFFFFGICSFVFDFLLRSFIVLIFSLPLFFFFPFRRFFGRFDVFCRQSKDPLSLLMGWKFFALNLVFCDFSRDGPFLSQVFFPPATGVVCVDFFAPVLVLGSSLYWMFLRGTALFW